MVPSLIVGAVPAVLTFSLTHSAARLEDSSVPALSSQTVAVTPVSSPVRAAAVVVAAASAVAAFAVATGVGVGVGKGFGAARKALHKRQSERREADKGS